MALQLLVIDLSSIEMVKQLKTIESKTRTVTDKETEAGRYTVKAILKTSLGDRTSDSCTKEFQIVELAKCPQNPALLATDPNCRF